MIMSSSLALSINSLNSVALGDKKANLVLVNCNLLSVYTREIIPKSQIAIVNDRIAYVGPDATHTIGPKTKVIDIHEINPILNQKKNEITGHVIYIDNYENVVLNITKDIFQKFGKSRPYLINARNYQFKKIYKNYSDAIKFDIKKESRKEEGKKIAIFNKSNYLELAIYKSNPEFSGGASSLFGLKYRDVITISFQ